MRSMAGGLGSLLTYMATCAVLAGCVGCTEERTVVGPPPPPPPPPPSPKGLDACPAWSPDGRTVAYWAEEQSSTPYLYNTFIRLVDAESREITTICDEFQFALNIDWSPDGRWLLLSGDRGIWKILVGGDSSTVLMDGSYASASWSRVSGRIFFSNEHGSAGGVYSMNPDGTDVIRHTSNDSDYVSSPHVFPDSDSMVVLVNGAGYRDCIALLSTGEMSPRDTIHCDTRTIDNPRMSPDHGSLYFTAYDSQLSSYRVLQLHRLSQSLRPLAVSAWTPFGLSPDGRFIVYSDTRSSRGLQILKIETGQIFQLTPGYQ